MFLYKKYSCFTVIHIFSFLHSMTFDLISGLRMQIQTWHPPLWFCTHANYYVKSGLTNVLKNLNKANHIHLFFIWIAYYNNNEPWHGIYNNVVCVTSQASDQPAHTRRLIRTLLVA